MLERGDAIERRAGVRKYRGRFGGAERCLALISKTLHETIDDAIGIVL
jgi:hypothetical protein